MALNLVADGRRNDLSSVRGLVFGVATFLVGYLVVFLAKGDRIGDLASAVGGDGLAPAAWQVAGWVFFSAHQVGTGATMLGRSEALPIQESLLWQPWFVLVPVVALLVAGFLAASASNATDAFNGFSTGAAIVVGYLPLAVVLNVLVTVSATNTLGTITVGPNILFAAALAGAAYPVVFGGIGGTIAGLVR